VKVLRELRRRKGLSQKDLAGKSGVGQDTISGIESGRHQARPSTLRKLADALGVEVEDLFREPEAPKAPTVPQSLAELRDFLETRLGSAWIALPDEDWKNWWRNVSMEEAAERYEQILAEGKLIYDTWGRAESIEEIAAITRSGVNTLRFRRRFEAAYFAPQPNESEEDFQERSAQGRATQSFYDPVFQEQWQDSKEEERQLVGTQA
jgi:transcriptional regulator with XRE-family HTH domain